MNKKKQEKIEKHIVTCPSCGTPRDENGYPCGCYDGCADIDYHNGERCDGSC
jgi:endogenous inhibitor of DNA gyrase (YacG/DUF329 family)